MGLRLHRQNPVASSASAVPATHMSPGAIIARTMRTRWWPRFLLAGVLLVLIGVMFLSGTVQAAALIAGVTVFLFAAVQGLSGKGYTREPPVPPGSGRPLGPP